MPFLIPLLALSIGIIVGNSLQLPAWGILPILSACGVYLYILKKSSLPLPAIVHSKSHKVWIFLLFAGIGIFDMAYHKPVVYQEETVNRYVLAEGEIIESNSFASGDRFVVDVIRMADSSGQINQFHNFRILLYSDGLSAGQGEIITFPSKFSPITDNPNLRSSGFSERMKKLGIYYKVNAGENEINVKGFHHTFSNDATDWRNRLVAKIENSSLSRPACNFIVALMLGDKSLLSEDVHTKFSNAGVAHVLALSGMHVAIIMGIVLSILFPLKLAGLHILRYYAALLIMWVYAFFTGMSPSTVRACIMTTFVVVAMTVQRRNIPENALLASAFIILLFSPLSLFDISMQLSFLCVGSILLFAGPLNPINRHSRPVLHSTVAAVLVSLVATVTTWVIVSFYFRSIPLLFLPVNLCLLPLLPVYMWLASIYIILLVFGSDFSFLAYLLNKGYDMFSWIASNLSAFGEATVSIDVTMPVVILWILGILILAYALKKKTDKNKIIIIGGLAMMAGAIICIPLLGEKSNDGIIFQKDSHNISLAIYDGNIPSLSTMPRNTISRIFHKGCEILSIDCADEIDSLTNILATSPRGHKRYLILGSGLKGTTLRQIPGIKDYDKIILHSSMKRKMENKLRQEAVDIGIKTIYSLREEGPLEELLPDSLPTIK